MKQLKMFFIGVFLLPLLLHAQNTFTVADGTEICPYGPILGHEMNTNQQTQSLYLDNTLTAMRGKQIDSLVYYAVSSDSNFSWTSTVSISIGVTSVNSLSSNYDQSPHNEVYTGSLSVHNNRMVIALDKEYVYPITGGNLLIHFRQIHGGNNHFCSFYGALQPGLDRFEFDNFLFPSSSGRLPKVSFFFSEAPNCPRPNLPRMINRRNDRVTVTWDPVGTENSWQIVVSDTAITSFSGIVPQTIYTNPYTLTGLLPSSEYHVYVRARCDETHVSKWNHVVVQTECNDISLPYFENFDSLPSAIDSRPACWTMISPYHTHYYFYPHVSDTDAFSPDNCLMMSSYSYAITPRIPIPCNEIELSFRNRMISAIVYSQGDEIVVGFTTNPLELSTNFIALAYLPDTCTWENFTLSFADLNITDTGYIVFRHDTYLHQRHFFSGIDDLMVRRLESCSRPTTFRVDSVEYDAAYLSWSDTFNPLRYEVVVSDTAVTDFTDVVVRTTTDTSLLVNGLIANTEYMVYLRSICSDDTSFWVSERFRTSCAIAYQSIPYHEGFESYYVGDVPNCWTRYAVWARNFGTFPSVDIVFENNHSGERHLLLVTNNDGYTSTNTIATPAFENLNTLQVSFYAKNYFHRDAQFGYAGNSMMRPQLFSVGVMEGSVYIPIDTIALTDEYQPFTVFFNNYPDTGSRIAFHIFAEDEDEGGVCIDDVVVDRISACIAPADVQALNIQATQLDLIWNNVSGASQWFVAYSKNPTQNPDTLSYVTVSDNPCTITGLDTSTTYYFYVACECPDNNLVRSSWSDPLQVSTARCALSCGFQINMANWFISGWDDAAVVVMQGSDTIARNTIATGRYDTAYFTVCSLDSVRFYWEPGNTPYATSFSILDPTGVEIFSCSNGSMLTPVGCFFSYMPNCVPPACPRPQNLMVSHADATSIDLAWTEMGGATSWYVYTSPTPVSNWTGITGVHATTNPYTITGLDTLTSYYFYVRADCGGTSSTWSNPLQAATTRCDGGCAITLILQDAYGDGWDDAYLAVIQGGDTIAFATVPEHSSNNTTTVFVCPNTPISFYWSAGFCSFECSFSIFDSDGNNWYTCPIGTDIPTGVFLTRSTSCWVPTCNRPENVYVENVLGDGATVHWTDSVTGLWQVEYGPLGFFPGTGTIDTVTIDSLVISGLSSSSNYQVYVSSLCSDTVLTANPLTFVTTCGRINHLPYMENFDSYVSQDHPACWTCYNNFFTYPYFPVIRNGQAYSLPNSLDFWANSSHSYSYGVLPPVNTEIYPVYNLRLTGMARKNSDFTSQILEVGVMTDPNDTATFFTIDTIAMSVGNLWEHFEVDFRMYPDTGAYIALRTPWGVSSAVYVDDIVLDTIPNCDVPNHLTSIGIFADSVILTWNDPAVANDCVIAYDTVPVTMTSDFVNTTTVVAPTNPFVITGLQPDTRYYFYVKAHCVGDIYSSYSSGDTITTQCNTMTTLPLYEGFEGIDIPDCWSYEYVHSHRNWTFGQPGTNDASSYQFAHTGNNNASFRHSMRYNTTKLITPVVDLTSINDPCVSFWYIHSFWGLVTDQDTLRIFYRTSPDSAWVFLEEYNDNATQWTEAVIRLPHASDAYQVAFEAADGYGHGIGLDDVYIGEAPGCPAVSSIQSLSTTAVSVTLGWIENGSANRWYVQYGLHNQPPTNAVTATSTQVVISGLNANTDYDFYVSPICLNGDTGVCLHPLHVATAYCENSCWISVKMHDRWFDGWRNAYLTVHQGDFTQNLTLTSDQDSADVSLVVCAGDSIDFTWHGSFEDSDISFYIFNNMGDTIYSCTHCQLADGVFFTYLPTCLSVDCLAPIQVVATPHHNSVTLNWSGDSGTFEVAVKPVASVDWPANAMVLVQHYTAQGLLPATDYQYRVRRNCGMDGLSQWVEGTFSTTATPCPTPSRLTTMSISSNAVELSWIPGGTETNWQLHIWGAGIDSLISVTGIPNRLVSGFIVNASYHASVRALCNNNADTSNWSDMIDFYTLNCDSVSHIIVGNVSATTAQIEWTAGDNNIGDWELEYGEPGMLCGEGVRVRTETPSFLLTQLEPNTSYDLYIRARCQDENVSTWSRRVVFSTASLGIGHTEKEPTLNLYPNPAHDKVTLTGLSADATAIQIIDLQGRIILETKLLLQSGESAYSLTLPAHMASGTYFVRIIGGSSLGSVITKFVVK